MVLLKFIIVFGPHSHRIWHWCVRCIVVRKLRSRLGTQTVGRTQHGKC